MPVETLDYLSYAWLFFFAVTFATFLASISFHFFVPKIMIETYFKEPYFSPLEIKLFTGPPYAYIRTAMMMRLAAWPDCGKKRGIPANAHEICPVWFQVVSRVLIHIFIVAFIFFILSTAILSTVVTIFDLW